MHSASASTSPSTPQHFLARLFRRGDRVAGVRRIDEHEVEVLEPGLGIVRHRVGRRRHRPVLADDDTLRPQRAQMQPDRRRARAAVEDEAHRPRSRVGVGEEIGGREDRRFGIAALVVDAAGRHRDERGDRAVVERLAIERDARFALVRRCREQLVDLVAQAFFRVVVGGRRGWWFRVGHGSEEKSGARREC